RATIAGMSLLGSLAYLMCIAPAESILRQFRIAPVAKLLFQHVAGIDNRAFAGQPFHFAQKGFQLIERNAFIFVVGGIEIEILPNFADKILCLIFHVAGS